jgi:hypothetical protein
MKALALSDITPTTPLRLDIAARIAFPDGSLTKSGLRREIARGRLECERIAGKQYVTLAAIEAMRIKCRENSKALASISGNAKAATLFGSSSTEQQRSALASAQNVAEMLKKPSLNTLAKSIAPSGTTVIHLRS